MRLLTLFVLFSNLVLAACNTIQGMGEDIEAAGGAISGGAENTKRKMH